MSYNLASRIDSALCHSPVLAILRGVRPEEVVAIVQSLYDSGIRIVEVPLNSPEPYESINNLSKAFNGKMIIGAGTVLNADQVKRVFDAGGEFIVSPNTHAKVIKSSIELGMIPMPGVATPSDAFMAIDAGAKILKLFPAGCLGANWIKAIKPVLPIDVSLLAVGGVDSSNAQDYVAAGCVGVGIGGQIYKPGTTPAQASSNAIKVINSLRLNEDKLKPETIDGVTVQAQTKCVIAESPVWHKSSNEIHWVSPTDNLFFKHSLDSGQTRFTKLSQPIVAIDYSSKETLYGVADNSLFEIDSSTGDAELVLTVEFEDENSKFNDAQIDSNGFVWVGAYEKSLKAGGGMLWRLDPSTGASVMMDSGLGMPNGLGWSVDGTVLYLVDTLAKTLIAYSYDCEHGTVSKPRLILDLREFEGKPDGLCVDNNGAICVALWGGGCVVKVSDQGVVLETIKIPSPLATSCCVGGVDQDMLFITSSTFRMSDAEMKMFPQAGSLFSTTLNTGER